MGYTTLFYDTAAKDFSVVQKDVAELITGRVLIGHALHHDLKVIRVMNLPPSTLLPCLMGYNLCQVLLLGHPKKDIRDTSEYEVLRGLDGLNTCSSIVHTLIKIAY